MVKITHLIHIYKNCYPVKGLFKELSELCMKDTLFRADKNLYAMCDTQEFLDLQMKGHLWNLWVMEKAFSGKLWFECVINCLRDLIETLEKYRKELWTLITTSSIDSCSRHVLKRPALEM
jgi:hypothetical protein